MTKRLLVVGAGGDVGQGIVAMAAKRGWSIAASGRDLGKLTRIVDRFAAGVVKPVVGNLASPASAELLWNDAATALGGVDAVVVAVNAPNTTSKLLDWNPADLLGVLDANVITHFTAAKVFVPKLASDGVFIGVGGGTADFVPPGGGQLSMAQAALRMMYRAIIREASPDGPTIREMMIVSMVNGESRRDVATSQWLTDVEIGEHICAMIAEPERFPGPVEALRSREQIGEPEPRPAKAR